MTKIIDDVKEIFASSPGSKIHYDDGSSNFSIEFHGQFIAHANDNKVEPTVYSGTGWRMQKFYRYMIDNGYKISQHLVKFQRQ